MASLGEDLLGVVNRLQDLVFNTIGNDSLDLPQIVRLSIGGEGLAEALTYRRLLSGHSLRENRPYWRTSLAGTSYPEEVVL